ncbi:MAG: hypothetical protein RL748_3283 [Pseudomonadota bacterium]
MNPMQLELQVNQAAADLKPEQFAQFRRLARALAAHEKRWGLFLLKYEHTDDRRMVADAITKLIPRNTCLVVSAAAHPDWPALEQAICGAAQRADVVQLMELDAWLDTSVEPERAEARLRAWNVRRDGFAAEVAVPVICWLRSGALKTFAITAPDLWSWRAAVHDFSAAPDSSSENIDELMVPFTESIDNRSLAQRTLRLREIQQYLQEHPAQNKKQLELAGLLILEMADIHIGIGELDEALQLCRNQALPVFSKLGDDRNIASIKGRIVTILRRRGEFAEALEITKNEIIPILKKTGTLHDLAISIGQIAEIQQARGDYQLALTTLREEVLPNLEKAGDTHAYATTLSKIADALMFLGDFDQALEVNRNQALPLFEKIGAIRDQATILGKIASIFQMRGELTEALFQYREVLPIFEKLGDVHSHAVASSNIATIMHLRGESAEALRRYREALPVFEKTGDQRAVAIVQEKIQAIINSDAAAN